MYYELNFAEHRRIDILLTKIEFQPIIWNLMRNIYKITETFFNYLSTLKISRITVGDTLIYKSRPE